MGRINKISNKAKNRIASLLFIVIAVILLANSWVVKAAENVIRKTDDHSGNYKIPGYITYEQYANDPYLLCTARGVSIPGYSKTMVVSGEHKTHTTDQGKDTGYLTANDLGTSTCFANEKYTDLVSTKSHTYGYYTEAIVHDATPAETYVLAELEENTPGNGVEYEVTDQLYENQDDVNEEAYIEVDGEKYYIVEYDEAMQATAFVAKKEDGKYYVVNAPNDGEGQGANSYVQIAWWAVATVQEKGRAEDNSLAKEAREFENYINQLSEGGKYSIINENGEKQTEVTSISLNKTSLKMSVGDTEQLKVTMQPSNLETQDIVWKTSNKSIAMIDADGNVAAKAAGKATISVYLKSNEQMVSNCIVTVKDPNEEEPENDTKVTELYVNKGEIVIETGKTATFTITMKPSKATNKKCTINIEDKNIVTFDKEDGSTKVILKGLKEGTTTVTVTLDDDQNIKDTIKVTVKDTLIDEDKKLSVHRVDLDKDEITLRVGDSSKLTATVLPTEAEVRNYSYKSSDDTIATVDDNGNVKGVKEGTATITVTTEDGNKTDTCKVNVKTTLDDEDPYTVDGKYESPVVGGNRFDIEYPVEMESENAEVLYDATTNTYKIGPFSTKYLRYITKQGDREAADFSGITKSTLIGKFYRDGEEFTEEIPFENYKFVYEHDHTAVREANNQVDTDESYPYPYSEEEFFIELNYMEDLASISGFRFDFHYWNGGGTFTVFKGNYLVITWQVINTGIAPGNSSSTASIQDEIKVEKVNNSTQNAERVVIKYVDESNKEIYIIVNQDGSSETVTYLGEGEGPLQPGQTGGLHVFEDENGNAISITGNCIFNMSDITEVSRDENGTTFELPNRTQITVNATANVQTDTTGSNALTLKYENMTQDIDATAYPIGLSATKKGRVLTSTKFMDTDIVDYDASTVSTNGTDVEINVKLKQKYINNNLIDGITYYVSPQNIKKTKTQNKSKLLVKENVTIDFTYTATSTTLSSGGTLIQDSEVTGEIEVTYMYINTLEEYANEGNITVTAEKITSLLALEQGGIKLEKKGFLDDTKLTFSAENVYGFSIKEAGNDGCGIADDDVSVIITKSNDSHYIDIQITSVIDQNFWYSVKAKIKINVPDFHFDKDSISIDGGTSQQVVFFNACKVDDTGNGPGMRGEDGAVVLPETLPCTVDKSGINFTSLNDVRVDESVGENTTIDGYTFVPSWAWYNEEGEVVGFEVTAANTIEGLTAQITVEAKDKEIHADTLTISYSSPATASEDEIKDLIKNLGGILIAADVTSSPSQSQTTPGGEDPGKDPEPGEEETEAGTGAVNLFDNETYIDFLEDGFEIDLTTDLSGMVWDDDEEGDASKGEDMFANGVYNSEEGDVKLSKIEVIIWKVTYEKSGDGKYVETDRVYADAYRNKTIDENGSVTLENLIKFDSDNIEDRLFTDESGDYKAFVNVPAIEDLETDKYKVSYDVEFIYDGQTYETTEYLASTGETETGKKVEVFMSTSSTDNAVVDYSKYAEDSYAIETYEERKAFDSKFTEIYGESSIDTEGKTTGEASKTTPDGAEEDKTTLNYVAEDQGFDEETEDAEGNTDENTTDNEETRKVSKLITTDDGYVRDAFKMKARTSTAGLLLPYEDRVHLEEKQEDIELEYIDTGVEGSYTYYKPITEYFSHINLGLVRRNDVDLTVMQDLYKAGVTVNQGELTYKYSTLVDLEHSNYANKLNMLLDVQNAGVNYEIGLYASDFYYRSDVYTADKQTEITKKIAGAKADSELRLFAGYRISVYNDSRDHDVSINELADYYDSTYTLVSEDIKTNLTDANGNIQADQVVAESSYYRIYTPIASDLGETPYNYNRDEDTSIDGDLVRVNRTDAEKENMISGNVEWKLVEDFEATLTPIEGTEGGSYKKMVTESFTSRSEDGTEHTANELTLRPGEKLEIFVTFEVDHDGYDNATSEEYTSPETRNDLLGNKNNVVEISNYTTYYTEKSLDKNNNVAYKAGDVSGRVDKDSAADNINFSMTEKVTVGGKDYTVLDKSWFEDDTESAPVFRVYLRDIEAGARELNGVVWKDSLTENVEGADYTKTGNGIYDEGETTIPGATVTLVEKIKIDGTEYEYVWPDNAFGEHIPGYTSVTMSDANGLYTLNNFVSGNYVVRFEYGNTAMTMDYNGQDYKNTSYQEGIKNPTEEALINAYTDSTEVDQNNNLLVHTELMNNDQWDTEAETVNQELKEQITLNNEWHDLTGLTEGLTNSEDEKRVSDARDYEARRLDVIDYSRTIDNSVAEIFAIADSTTLQNLKAKLAEKMYGETPMTYGEALDAIKAEDAELKAFVESDEYRALIAFTAMEANTAKLNVLIENSAEVDFGRTKKSTDGAFQVNVGGSYEQIKDAMINSASGEKYTIANIDFGLERRADTIIQTDKYMTEIELMKENERVFFIEINEDGTIKTTENTLAAEKVLTVLESQGVQGFKYINVEEDFLKNSTLNISYNVRVTNKSEVDYASEELVTKSYTTTQLDNHINTLLADAVTGEDMKYGKYVGLYYYTHDNSAVGTAKTVAGQEYKDAVVKTTVDQMVDYVDTNIELAETSKTLVENNAWNLAEIQSGDTYGEKFESLKGLISDDSYTKEDGEEPKEYLQNDKGDLYISESRSKVAISSNSNIKEDEKTGYVLSRGEKGQGQLTYEMDPSTMTAINYIGHKKYEQNQRVKTENVYVYKDNLGTAYNADVHNKDLTKELYSINYKEDTDAARTATIKVQTSQDVGSTVDMEHMLYNNIAEVLVYSNAVGRRSMSAIPGNAIEIVKVEPDSMDTAKGGGSWNAGHSSNEHKDASIVANRDSDATQLTFQGTMLYAIATKEALANNTEPTIHIAELDTDAADYVTFTEPTGLSYAIQQQNMFIIIMLVALVVLAAGIILITVKVVMTKSTDDVTIESTKE